MMGLYTFVSNVSLNHRTSAIRAINITHELTLSSFGKRSKRENKCGIISDIIECFHSTLFGYMSNVFTSQTGIQVTLLNTVRYTLNFTLTCIIKVEDCFKHSHPHTEYVVKCRVKQILKDVKG
ncbi:CLUMA_CG004263, isoform A [Clunio marinus]|uniref:CLUMA_CG004263, isoform A n=1 Tax=Clunio marinus TaxID=568069 RepID=A0A1J1HR59_9DIPT|nr:CLUMA_CG004263, isoform A [Clunio marinus]